MDKNKFAVTPPMGWNSYDYYDTTVNEDQVKANADYMAKHLKEFGWQYIVIDIEWFACYPIRRDFPPRQAGRAFSLWRIMYMPWD